MKKKKSTTVRSGKSQSVCKVALSVSNDLTPLMVCLESLLKQLQKVDPQATVKQMVIRDRWINFVVSAEKSDIGFDPKQLKQGNDFVECKIFPMNVQAAMDMIKEMSHRLFRLKTMRQELVKEMVISKQKWTIRTQPDNPTADKTSKENMMKKKEMLLLIDGSNVLTRAYYATTHKPMKTRDGRFTNAVYSMILTFFRLLKKYTPSHVAIMWDVPRSESHRKAIFSEYKGNRKDTEPALKQQFGTAKELFAKMQVPQFTVPNMEADDLIGTAAVRWTEKNSGPVIIVSNDRDLYQLLNDRVSQLIVQKKGERLYTAKDFVADFGIEPSQWADAKALLGDKSDNIPGVQGMGEKTVFPLLKQFINLEAIYNNLFLLEENFGRYILKLIQDRDNIMMSKKLASLKTDVEGLDIDQFQIKMSRQGTLEAFQDLEFESLLETS